MNTLTEIHRAKGINIHGRTIHRAAVRAVILRGQDLLMVYSANVGDYKLPGGGVDDGESLEQALRREILKSAERSSSNLGKASGRSSNTIYRWKRNMMFSK